MPDDQLAERIDSLRDDVENDQVAELLDVLEEIRRETATTRETTHDIDDRLSYVEDFTGASTNESIDDLMSPNFDHRDAAVLRVIRERNPEQLSVSQIQEIYIQRTDVHEKTTLRKRIKELVDRGPFENADGTIWRFTAYQSERSEEPVEA